MRIPLRQIAIALAVAGFASIGAAGGPQSKGAQKGDTSPANSGDKPVENFLQNARLGDWVRYRSSGPTPTTFKQTVIAKTADEITLRSEIRIGDMDLPVTEPKISLKAPFDPDKSSNPDVTTTVEKLRTGEDVLVVVGKRYECTWVKNRVTHTTKATSNSPATTSLVISKKWMSKDVPLSGMVKSEVEMAGQTTVTELTEFGRGK